MKYIVVILSIIIMCSGGYAHAANLDTKQPIEITADSLEVLQERQQAIFTGNVLAKQGVVNMRAARMVVYYKQGGANNNVSKIEAEGDVLFTTPDETAQGSRATYDVDADKIHLLGDITLTRDKNILKGSKLEYNLATGRSIVTGGPAVAGQKSNSGRVKGLFVPNQ